jgi:NAD(P)-dependent dehydrogenase (short-subunit alcohol dehydrogenase family)
MKNLFSVADKNVIITGGSGGIGTELVKGFVEAGANVFSLDLVPPLYNERKFKTAVYDLSKREDCINAYKACLGYFASHNNGRIDVLINCAGHTIPCDNPRYPDRFWDQTFNDNLGCVWNLTIPVGAKMISQGGGSIINVTSINAAVAMPCNPAYAAAKAAIRHLTKSLAFDWGCHNVRVNNLGPGYTKTKMNKVSLEDPEEYKIRCDNSMLGRWAEPIEMVGPAIFLASDASSFVTGIDLWVDGGWISKGI